MTSKIYLMMCFIVFFGCSSIKNQQEKIKKVKTKTSYRIINDRDTIVNSILEYNISNLLIMSKSNYNLSYFYYDSNNRLEKKVMMHDTLNYLNTTDINKLNSKSEKYDQVVIFDSLDRKIAYKNASSKTISKFQYCKDTVKEGKFIDNIKQSELVSVYQGEKIVEASLFLDSKIYLYTEYLYTNDFVSIKNDTSYIDPKNPEYSKTLYFYKNSLIDYIEIYSSNDKSTIYYSYTFW